MDFRGFMRLADGLIGRLAPRIDPQTAGSVRQMAHAGEWDLAIEELIAALRADRVTISVLDRAELLALARYMRWTDTALDGLSVRALEPCTGTGEEAGESAHGGQPRDRDCDGDSGRDAVELVPYEKLSGPERALLAGRLAVLYQRQRASIRDLMARTGRSYGFIHRLLTVDAGITLRGRGGNNNPHGNPHGRQRGASGVEGPLR